MSFATVGGFAGSLVPSLGVTTVVIAMLALFMFAMVSLAVAPLVSENRSARLGTDSSADRASIETNEAD